MKSRRKGVVLSIGTLVVFGMVWAAEGNAASTAQASAAQPAAQQGPPPQRVSVTTTQVKPDMVTTWQEIIKNETVPALKKAGVPWRWVFATGPLGQGFTYTTVTPITNFAQYDQPSPLQKALGADGLARYNAKIRPTLVSTNTVIQTLVANASLQSFSDKPPTLVIVTTTNLLPGKGQEFASITTAEFLPVLKKQGVTDYWVFATTFGAPNTQRTIVTTANSFADLDGGPALTRALGPEAAQKLNQKRAALTTGAETTILRFVPDLSFGAPTRPTTSSR